MKSVYPVSVSPAYVTRYTLFLCRKKKALCNCLFLGYTVLERFDRIFYSGLTCDPENLWITIMRKTDNDIRRIT